MQSDPTVFIVDDDEGAREATQWLLESAGLSVEPYSRAEDFLQTYTPSRAGCLVVDLVMPGMNGVELVRELDSRGCSMPIIMVTGSGDGDPRLRGLSDRLYGLLDKPGDPRALLDLVRAALKEVADGPSGS
ncbi:MAG: response regulator [Planctomycetes bacterium]|nr:response regulator [Planctomycetota bacterium]MBL7040029.1 response regulator [Pirellulaceae bacterium]